MGRRGDGERERRGDGRTGGQGGGEMERQKEAGGARSDGCKVEDWETRHWAM